MFIVPLPPPFPELPVDDRPNVLFRFFFTLLLVLPKLPVLFECIRVVIYYLDFYWLKA